MSIHQLPRCLNNIELRFDLESAYLRILNPGQGHSRVNLKFDLETLRKYPDNRPLEKLVYATMAGPEYNYVLEKGVVTMDANSQHQPRELIIWIGTQFTMTIVIPMCQELANALLDIQDRADRL